MSSLLAEPAGNVNSARSIGLLATFWFLRQVHTLPARTRSRHLNASRGGSAPGSGDFGQMSLPTPARGWPLWRLATSLAGFLQP